MKIEDYISSGVLESYVLGQLNKEEAAKVEKMAAKFPSVKKELAQIEDGLNAYAMSHSKSPSPDLKDKIMARLDEKASKSSKGGKVVDFNKRSFGSVFLIAASLSLAVVSGGAAVFFWQQAESAKKQLVAYQQANTTLAGTHTVSNPMQDSIKSISEKNRQLQDQIALLRDTNTLFVPLKGLPLSPTSKVAVIWKKDSKEVFIDVKSLPAPPTDMQYQLWALEDGKPIDAGVFNVGDSLGLQRMKSIQDAQAFAVTLEKKGGNEFPTLDNMYVMGKVVF